MSHRSRIDYRITQDPNPKVYESSWTRGPKINMLSDTDTSSHLGLGEIVGEWIG